MRLTLLVLSVALGSPVFAQSAAQNSTTDRHAALNQTEPSTDVPANTLPPLPEGVTQLRFNEFFQPPGRRGLEYTEKLKTLDGKKVRILGYMVRRTNVQWGRFMLAPVPVTLPDAEYGLADDLPASTLFVELPPQYRTLLHHTPGLMLLTGTLHLGPQEEIDGRTSYVRLVLDPPPRQSRAAPVAGAYPTHPMTDEESRDPRVATSQPASK